ncbi:DUF4232 domain-containing protein [Streptomyces sp. NPDC127108]|uniref:DUF4232 domain-containing protein n=1 Tax=Streptomyces sp. NPDC127108 TaxID=3345361 RepID=UPI0036297AF6
MRTTLRTRTAATALALSAALSLPAFAGSAAASGTGAEAAPVTCTAANTKVTVKKVDRPVNHLLLRAKNTGTKTCYAYHAPYLRFGQSQAATAVLRESVPQAVITLEPGKSAYAGIRTESPEGTNGFKTKKLGVLFSNRAHNGGAGTSAKPKLPTGGVYVDDSAFVTYWQSRASDALAW